MSWYPSGQSEYYAPTPEDDIMQYIDLGYDPASTLSDPEVSEDAGSVKSEHISGDDKDLTIPSSASVSEAAWQNYGQSITTPPSIGVVEQPFANTEYKAAEEFVQSLAFGRTVPLSDEHTPSPLEIVGEGDSRVKYKLVLGELPERSRVETQIKCTLFITPPPPENLLCLPTDLIARPRFQLETPIEMTQNMLHLDIDVIVAGDQQTSLNMCSKCIAREKKRAFRKKTLDPNEEYHWNVNKARRLAILNCREMTLISQPAQVDLGGNEPSLIRKIELPLRLACYCRHHNAQNGYNLLLTLRDHNKTIVGQTISQPLSITDNHKEPRHKKTNASSASGGGFTSSWSDASSAITSPFDSSSDHSISHVRRQSSSFHPYQRHTTDAWAPRSNSVSSVSDKPVMPDYLAGPLTSNSMAGSSQLGIGSHSRALSNVQAVAPTQILNNDQQGGVDQACIQRAIPGQGSIRGGVEVTLLGRGFRPGLTVLFGDTPAITTQCWSDSTLICHLPPATSAGPVSLTFKDVAPHPQSAIFTYINDSEVKLVELALQVVGFKMSGKLEDAADVASKIVNREYPEGVESTQFPTEFRQNSTEDVVLSCLQFLQLPNTTGRLANINLRNTEGQTMLHLACILGYNPILITLLSLGANVDMQDVSGMTPLHFAAMMGNRAMARHLLQAHADPFHRHNGGKNAMEVADSSVLDLFPRDQRSYYQELNTSSSHTNLTRMLSREDVVLATPNMMGMRAASPVPPLHHTGSSTDAETGDDMDVVSAVKKAREMVKENETNGNQELMAFFARLFGKASEFTTQSKKAFGVPKSPTKTESATEQRVESPPKYRDLYPSSPSNSLQNSPGKQYPADQSRDRGATLSSEPSSFESWTTGPLKQMKNDHLLFTFWIPLLVIAFTYVVALFMDISGEVISSKANSLGSQVGKMFGRYSQVAERIGNPT